eukprot:Em0003g1848a
MPSRKQKKRSKQRAEYLQKREDILSQENKAKARARYKADPEKKKASVRDTYKADPEKKKASVRDTYKADPVKKKASVRDTYKADPEKKKASVRDTYNANAVSKRAAKRQRYQEGVEENPYENFFPRLAKICSKFLRDKCSIFSRALLNMLILLNCRHITVLACAG